MVCYCLQLFVTRDYVYCLQSHHRLVNDLSTVVQLTNRLLHFCLTEGLFTTKESAVHLFSSTLDPYIITSWFAIVLDEIKNYTDFKRKADCKQSSGTYLAKINPSNPPPPSPGVPAYPVRMHGLLYYDLSCPYFNKHITQRNAYIL